MAAVLGGALLVIIQRPDAVLTPQFWAEDGAVFFADAYNRGVFTALVKPYAGYLHLFPRLVAAVASLVPFGWAPLLMNASAILVGTVPAALLVSGRCDELIPDPRARIALATAYLVMPMGYEVAANATNTNWHLAVLAALLVVTSKPTGRVANFIEALVLAMAALSGPTVVLLLPIAVMATWVRERRAVSWRVATLAACALIQLVALALNGRPAHGDLGASWIYLTWILGIRVFLGAFVGEEACKFIADNAGSALYPVSVVATAAGSVFVAYAVRGASTPVRLFAAFAALVLTSALMFPLSSWQDLGACTNGGRYYFIPSFALLLLTASLWTRASPPLRVLGPAAAALVAYGAVAARLDPPRRMLDLDFREATRVFESAPSGTVVTIPINPRRWRMKLVKH